MPLDDEHRARYARQIMLPELGLTGQERIAGGCAALAAPDADVSLVYQVAERYARRAGFDRLAEGHIDIDTLAPKEIVHHQAPRAVLAGARAALAAMREVAGVAPSQPGEPTG